MSKLLPGNETVLAMPAVEIDGVPYIFHASTGAAVSMFAATKAVLDSWIARTDNTGGTIGGNISGAIRDDMRLGLTDSATSTSRTITSVGKGEKLTYHNFVATLNIFRDADADPSTFNLAKDTTRVQDVPFVLAHRLGAKHTAAATVGEDWSYYFVHTGQPVPGFGDGEDQTIALAFVPKNIVHVKAALGS